MGTSAVKVGWMDANRWVVKSAPVAGTDEGLKRGMLNPEDWWNATYIALRSLADVVPLDHIDAIGVIGNTPTLIFVDPDGKPLYPAILWSDTRSHFEAQQLLGEHTQVEWNEIYGGYIPVSAAYPSAKLRWMQRHEQDVIARTAKILQPKDFVNFHLTNVMAGDVWTSKGLVRLDSADGADPLAVLGLNPSLAPICRRPIDVIGQVTADAAAQTGLPEGIPVVAGWSDTLGAVVSMGLQGGDGFILSGTSDSVGILTKREIPPQKSAAVLCAPVWDSGYTVVYGPTSSGLSTVHWAEKALSLNLLNMAPKSFVDEGFPIFLPFVMGQRSPIWNDHVRGAWLNIDMQTTPEQLGVSVLQGVVMADRDVMEVVQKLMGESCTRLVVTGGGANIQSLNAWRSALFNLPLFPMSTDPVWGAALLAYWGQHPQDFPHSPLILPWPAPVDHKLKVSQSSRYERYAQAKETVLRYAVQERERREL